MNFSWLSGGDERRMRNPGDGSSLLLTHHREVHRLQSLSMKPNRHYCFNYPALSSIPLSIKKRWATWSAKGGGGDGVISWVTLVSMPSHLNRGNDVTVIEKRSLDHLVIPLQYNCNLCYIWRSESYLRSFKSQQHGVVRYSSTTFNSRLHHSLIFHIFIEDKLIKHQTAISILLYTTYHDVVINAIDLHAIV